MLMPKNGCILFNSREARRREEKRKRERNRKKKCAWGVWGQREVAGVRWKHITHPRVPMTSRCSPPSALPMVRVPHRRRAHAATRQRVQNPGDSYTLWARWERPRVSLAGAGLALSLAALRGCCTISGALLQALGIPLRGPLCWAMSPLLLWISFPLPGEGPSAGLLCTVEDGSHCISDQRLFPHTQSLSSLHPLVQGLCEPGS